MRGPQTNRAESGSERRARSWAINSPEKLARLFAGELAVCINLAAHEALHDEHLFEGIRLIDEFPTTLAANRSGQSFLLGSGTSVSIDAPYQGAIKEELGHC